MGIEDCDDGSDETICKGNLLTNYVLDISLDTRKSHVAFPGEFFWTVSVGSGSSRLPARQVAKHVYIDSKTLRTRFLIQQ